MQFTWLLFLRILQAILKILMELPDNVDPRAVCRDINDAIDGAAPVAPNDRTV